jgi:hypothetical protein
MVIDGMKEMIPTDEASLVQRAHGPTRGTENGTEE